MLWELCTFAGGRLATLVIDTLLMMLFVTVMSMREMIAKIIVQVVVIVLNYFISKWIVFRKPSGEEQSE